MGRQDESPACLLPQAPAAFAGRKKPCLTFPSSSLCLRPCRLRARRRQVSWMTGQLCLADSTEAWQSCQGLRPTAALGVREEGWGLASLGLWWYMWNMIPGESRTPKRPPPSPEMPQALGPPSLGLGTVLPQLPACPLQAPPRCGLPTCSSLPALPCPSPVLTVLCSVSHSASCPLFLHALPPHYAPLLHRRSFPNVTWFLLRILSMHCRSPSPSHSLLLFCKLGPHPTAWK